MASHVATWLFRVPEIFERQFVPPCFLTRASRRKPRNPLKLASAKAAATVLHENLYQAGTDCDFDRRVASDAISGATRTVLRDGILHSDDC